MSSPFDFDLDSLFSKETYDELEALGDFKTRMGDNNNSVHRIAAVLMTEAEERKVSSRVLWLLACGNIASAIASTLINLTEYHHEDAEGRSASMIEVGAAMSIISSTMIRRNLMNTIQCMRDGKGPEAMGLRRAEEGEDVNLEDFRAVLLAGQVPVGPKHSDGDAFTFLNQLGVALFGEFTDRSPFKIAMSRTPDSVNLDLDRQAHGLQIGGEAQDMAGRMATMLQEIARSVSGHYIAKNDSEGAVSITHHAVSMMLAYCATLSVNVIRRNEDGGRAMTRTDAANIYIQRVMETSKAAISTALAEVERAESEERLRFQQPVGEA